MKLSISLIVKNEEKHLEKCLSSIQNLMKKVESELIVVDTGSTDNTKKIAKRFTDKIYDFEWINDFAAARNFGLSKCSGDWVMYLDADEALSNDVSPLVNFFNSEDSKKIASARLILKSYSDSTLSVYSESHNLRVINRKLFPNVKFVGSIHEMIPAEEPCVLISQIVDHFGYIADTDSLKEKHRRNMPALLKEYERTPTDPRILAHLFYSCENEDKEKYISEWYTSLQKNEKDLYSLPVYVALIQTLLDGGETGSALFYVDEYIDRFGDRLSVTTLSVIALGTCALSNLGDSENAIEFFKVYKDLWDQFKNGSIPTAELETCVVFFGSTFPDYCGLALVATSEALKLGDKTLANKFLGLIPESYVPTLLKEQYDELKKRVN